MTSSPPIYTAPTDFSFEETSSNDNPTFRFSKAEVEDLRFSFRLLDVKKTGKVSRNDLVSLLTELAHEQNQPPQSNVHRLLTAAQSLPLDDSSFLTEDDFIKLVLSASSNTDCSEIEKVFDMFSDGKEYITLEDLSRVANDLGEVMSKDELREMLLRATNNKEEGVTLDEFTQVMNRKLFR